MLAIFLVLMFLSAFFSACETAIFSLSRAQISAFRSSSSKAAREVVECLRQPRHILVSILLGNELTNVAISVVGADIVAHLFPGDVRERTLIAVIVITPLLLVFGEIAPKDIALRFAKQLAPIFVRPLNIFSRIITPIRLLLSVIADGIIKLFGGKPEEVEPMVMEQEFRKLVDLGSKEGVIVEGERDLIHKVFEFTDKVVVNIITHRERVFMLPIDMPYNEMLAAIRKTEFSRIPIYEKDREDIVGILHVRDLFAYDRKRRAGHDEGLRNMLHAPIIVENREKIEPLLRKFQKGMAHMALVLDDQQHFLGIATLHDVLEEIFGKMEGA